MATLAVPFSNAEDFKDKNQVKAILDQYGYVVFSRMPIPYFVKN